jgi:ankyrin repeat protein
MFDKQLPARPSLEQYKKQAKDLARDCALGLPAALERIARHHPRLHNQLHAHIQSAPFSLTDAQLVLAREHGFESWPKFAAHIETLRLIRIVADLPDPVAAFIEAACVPRYSGHSTGTLEQAQLILQRYPHVATANIYTASILADEPSVKKLLTQNPKLATTTGGPHNWDALTHLCFSRYLRLDPERSEAFVNTARTLLDAGANAQTGWYELIDHPNPRPVLESTLYGAAGIAQHPELTRLLLERGADPNDEETPYHVVETYDNTVLKILLASGKLNQTSLNTILLRKADWHDEHGIQLALEHGADPNQTTRWGYTALHQALRRDNSITIIELLLNHGANPNLETRRSDRHPNLGGFYGRSIFDGKSAFDIATRRGRGDVLNLFEQRGFLLPFTQQDRLIVSWDDSLQSLIAACARNDQAALQTMTINNGHLEPEAGTLLAEFAGNGNTEGVRNLLDKLGIPITALYKEGDGYFDIAKDSTALHVAAWRARPETVKLLIARGAPINALDGKGCTALQLAIKAAVDSYWKSRRTPESIEDLLKAGASTAGIELPTGYDEADALLHQYAGNRSPLN